MAPCRQLLFTTQDDITPRLVSITISHMTMMSPFSKCYMCPWHCCDQFSRRPLGPIEEWLVITDVVSYTSQPKMTSCFVLWAFHPMTPTAHRFITSYATINRYYSSLNVSLDNWHHHADISAIHAVVNINIIFHHNKHDRHMLYCFFCLDYFAWTSTNNWWSLVNSD